MPPAAPTIPSHTGAIGVDPRASTTLRKSRIAAETPGALSVVSRSATTTANSEWANFARFATGNGLQDNLAQSSVEGHFAGCGFSGVDFGVSDLFTADTINLELPFMGRWQQIPLLASPGEIGIRCIVAWGEQEIFEGLFRLDPVGLQVPSPAQPIAVPPGQVHEMATRWGAVGSAAGPLTEALRAYLGHPITIGAIEGVGSDLRILLSTWVGQEAFSPQWLAGPLRMVVKYRNPPDPTQSAAQFRIGSAIPIASNLIYDSTKLEGEAGDMHAIQPDTLPLGATVYADARAWDEFDVAGQFSEPVEFTTLNATQSALLHDPGERARAACWYPAAVVPAARWRRNSEVAGGSNPNVWQCRFARADQPMMAFAIMGVEEDPIPGVNWNSSDPLPPTAYKAYTQMDRDFDGLGVLNTDPAGKAAYIWDEEGLLTPSAGEPTLYMRPSDGRWMAGWRGAAVIIRLRVDLATRSMVWADRNWDGRILQWPTVTRKVDDLLSGVVSAPAGDLVLSDHDGVMRKLIAHGQFPVDGWLTDNRPIEIRAMMDGSNYDEAPVVVEGVTRWPEGGDILSGGRATFHILPLELAPDRAEIGRDVFDEKVYPHLRESDKNKPIPEVFGVSSAGHFPAAVVDRGPAFGGKYTTFRGARSSGTLLDFRYNDIVIDPAWYQYVAPHIYVRTLPDGSPAPWQSNFDNNLDANWTVRQAGEGAGLFVSCGQVARLMIAKLGIPFADIETNSFDQFDAPCFLLITGPTKILTLLHRLQRSGLFRSVQRLDRRWIAVAGTPEFLDVGIVINDYQVIGNPAWRLRKEQMGATLDVSYPAQVGTPAEQRRSWPARSYRASSQYRMQTAVSAEIDTTRVSIFEEYAEKLETPAKDISIRTDRRALYAYPGTSIALNLNRALAPGGVEAWALCSVEKWQDVGPEIVDLDIRFARTLPDGAHP